MKRIGILGFGMVGSAQAYMLKWLGEKAIIYDTNPEKLEAAGESGYDIADNFSDLILSTSLSFWAIPSPSGDNGRCDTSYVDGAISDLPPTFETKIIALKSTVPPGTSKRLEQKIRHDRKGTYELVYNPEFLREKASFEDVLKPDFVVLGGENDFALYKVAQLYKGLDVPIIKTDYNTAEMIKYASNTYHATKVSYTNELSEVCDALGADKKTVFDALRRERRDHSNYLSPFLGRFGGHCLPKDLDALIFEAQKAGLNVPLLRMVRKVNDKE